MEPPLLPCTGESLRPGTNLTDGARLDISALGFWAPMEKAFFDVRVCHPGAKSNRKHKTAEQMYRKHETEKNTMYDDRIRQNEKATFTGLVYSTTGGMGPRASMFLKRLATLLSQKTGQKFSHVMGNLRRRLRFELLKTVLVAVRGHRGRYYQRALPVDELDVNLIDNPDHEDDDRDDDRGDDRIDDDGVDDDGRDEEDV